MYTDREQSFVAITRGYEQPPLEYGPQRLHYIYSIGIPQAYLTLFSILQGVVFGMLLTTFPFPQGMILNEFWSFVFRQYFYLPYLISLSILILIWIHEVSITLTGWWPHSFPQVGLVTLLTLFEVLTARAIPILPSWLFFTGWVSFIGGITLIRTGLMHLPEDFDAHLPFQQFGRSLKQSEIRRGKQYLFIGVSLIILAIEYDNLISFVKVAVPSLVILIPWCIYILVCILLSIMVLTVHHRSKHHRQARKAMYESTDIYIKNGIARYRKTDMSKKNTASDITLVPKEISHDHLRVRKPTSSYHFIRFVIGAGIVSAIILRLFFYKAWFKSM